MNKGFTLIELLVVVAIIGILATLMLLQLNRVKTEEDPSIKRCISEKVESFDKEGGVIGYSKMVEIKTHCGYMKEYK